MILDPKCESPRVLVVDDHAISGRHAVTVLRRHALEVRRAGSASEALRLALEWLPDAICVDLQLPDGDGVELIRQIRIQWPVEKTPARILVMTGDTSRLDPGEMAKLDVQHWLEKPVSGRQLTEFLANRAPLTAADTAKNQASGELQALFRAELDQRLPELDRAICRLDRAGVERLLHQLIASAAICREPELESGLRSLDARWRIDPASTEIAGLYQRVLDCCRKFMSTGGRQQP